MRARKPLSALVLTLCLAGLAARADEECTRTCRDTSRECREECAKSSTSSEAVMACRGECLAKDDACRCDCGEETFCEGGSKGQRGCGVLVAEKRARPPWLSLR